MALYVVFVREKIVFRLPSYANMKYYLKDASPIFFTDVICTIKDKLNYILLGSWVGMSDVVVYDLGSKFMNVILKPAGIVGTVLFPKIAKERNVLLFRKTVLVLFACTLGLVIVLNLFLPQVVHFFIDEEIDLLPIRLYLLAPVIVGVSSFISSNLMVALGYTKYVLYSIIVTTAVYLSLLAGMYFMDYLTSVTSFVLLTVASYLGELPVICFALTWIVFAGYTYAADLDLMGSVQLTHLLIFSIAFYLIFLLSVASIVRINIRGINQYLLGVIGLNNFVFLFFALCLLQNMELEQNYKGLVTLFVAAINFALFFWIKRKGEPFTFLMHTLLGIALTFVSVTIPIQLEGTFITLFWASEVMIILWFYSRFRLRVYEIFVWVLPVLTLGSYGMDVFHGCMKARYGDSSLFINGLFATGIFTGLSYWVDAWLVRPTRISTKGPLLTGCVVLYIAFVFDFYSYVDPSIVSFSYIETFTVAVLFAANVLLGKSYLPVSRNAGGYGLLLGLSLSLFGGMSLWVGYDDLFIPRFLLWVSLLLIGGHIFVLGRYYYKAFDAREKRTHGMTLYICLLSTILLAVGTNNLLNQLGLPDELSAGFSISLSLAGFMQMAVGMRLHLKVVRMISLATFSIVLLKLVMVDLWLLPTIGKVVVFIILGVILLILSFLYQKLKTVLFDDSL